jgi:hypothetical protein
MCTRITKYYLLEEEELALLLLLLDEEEKEEEELCWFVLVCVVGRLISSPRYPNTRSRGSW